MHTMQVSSCTHTFVHASFLYTCKLKWELKWPKSILKIKYCDSIFEQFWMPPKFPFPNCDLNCRYWWRALISHNATVRLMFSAIVSQSHDRLKIYHNRLT